MNFIISPTNNLTYNDASLKRLNLTFLYYFYLLLLVET